MAGEITEDEAREFLRQMGEASERHLEKLWRECGGTGPMPPSDLRVYVGGPHGAVQVWPTGNGRGGDSMGSEKPVWMEWWVQDGADGEIGPRVCFEGLSEPAVFMNAEDFMGGYVHPHAKNRATERARLAAAAPVLLRALLLNEWSSHEVTKCGVCGAWECFESPDAHDDDCQVDAALTLAGFPDQPSRDAARERMRSK